MNISTQLCGVVLLVLILIFYKRQKKLPLRTSSSFQWALYTTLVCALFDIASVESIIHMNHLPALLVELICKSYLVSLICVGYSCLVYVHMDANDNWKTKGNRLIFIYTLIMIFAAVITFISPIKYADDLENLRIFTYGPAVLSTYFFGILFVILNLLTAIFSKKRMNAKRREGVIIWMIFWLLAAIIQFFRNELLIVSFASSVGIVIVYLLLENPQNYIDRRTGLFNQPALMQYVKQLYSENKDFSVVVFGLEHSFQKGLSASIIQEIKIEIADFLSNIPGALAFKNYEDETLLFFNSKIEAEVALELIDNRMKSGWGYNQDQIIPYTVIHIPHGSDVYDEAEYFYLIQYIKQSSKEFTEKGYVTVDNNLIASMHKEREIEKLVFDAMENNRVYIHYQPIYSTDEKRFSSAEALVRILDEDGRIVPPGLFIHIAEKNGMILRLGEIIFDKVCSFIEHNDLAAMGIDYIEVNLSTVQCAYERLAKTYTRIMKKHNVSPGQINLEITESASITAKNILLNNMKQLIDYGVSFSLDDFGTGQSNLNYIIDMPVDIVKFDREMSLAYFENKKARYVMDAAMHMIHGLNLKIVSEGIETKEQYEAMENLGINYIQGYFFSKPLPENEFLKFIRQENGPAK